MGLEIERKFLVTGTPWKKSSQKKRGTRMEQGYLAADKHAAIRVRVAGSKAWLTVKGSVQGRDTVVRQEFEYKIPVADAREMLKTLAISSLSKTRHKISWKGHQWEVDVFEGSNKGLVIAEIELKNPEEDFEKPPWLRREVTHDPRYLNSNLSVRPWPLWSRPKPRDVKSRGQARRPK